MLEDIKNLGWEIDFPGPESLAVSIVADGHDPDIGKLKKPRLVSAVSFKFGVMLVLGFPLTKLSEREPGHERRR